MILSRRHGFVFIKTIKTASTSVEIFLSRLAGPEDVITYLPPPDEALRRQVGAPSPQNCINPAWKRRLLRLAGRKRLDATYFIHHNISAADLRTRLGAEWESLRSFTIVRDPFDRAISKFFNDHKHETIPRLHQKRRHKDTDINAYIRAMPDTDLTNWHLYTERDRLLVTDILRYERLADDLAQVMDAMGIDLPVTLPRAKGSWRLDRRHYSEILDPDTRARIERAAAREIETFGYGWRDAPPHGGGMTLDCFVISLERTPERATRLRDRLGEFGIAHGLFPAVDGLKGEHVAWPNYDEARCLARFGAPLTPAEIGTFASHYSLWRRCTENGRPVLILEDDASLVDGFDRALALAIAQIAERGLIRLAGLVDRRHRFVADLGERRLVRLLRGPLGNQAYALSPTAAKRLVHGAARWVEPVDLYLDRFWAHGVVPYAILPYPAVHLDEDASASTIGSARFAKRTGLNKLRREIYRVGETASRGLFNLTH